MKKVLDEEIINDILNIKIVKKNKIPYITYLGNNIIIYAITNTVLELLKTNLAIANLTIPFLTIKYIKEIYITRYSKSLKLSTRKLNGNIEKLNLKGITINLNDLIDSKIAKDDNNSRIIITPSGDVLKQEKNHVYLLNEEEKLQINSNLKEFKLNKALENKNYKHRLKLLKMLTIYIIITCTSIINTSYNKKTSTNNEESILNYYDDKNSLSEDELNTLLKDIEIEVMKITNDDKYSIDNVNTKEEIDNYLLLNAINNNPYANNKEKEVMYEFLDFFNSNPYLDTKEVYESLINLDFIRNYNPFSNGKDNYNNTVIKASYYNDAITYYCTPTRSIIGHEVTHAIFDTRSIPTAYVEGFAEIIENEYFKEENKQDYGGYNKNIAVTKATIDIISKDSFLEAMSTDDASIIKEELKEAYKNNNSYISEKAAYLHVNNFFKLLESTLDDTENTTEVTNMLMSFFAYNDEIYDYDKLDRLFKYASIVSEVKLDQDIHYYFNEEKAKTLTLN